MEIADVIGVVVVLILGCAFVGVAAIVLKLIYRAFMLAWGLV